MTRLRSGEPGSNFAQLMFPGTSGGCGRAGIREFRHAGSTHVYFSAPGGQVFRLIDVAYDGP